MDTGLKTPHVLLLGSIWDVKTHPFASADRIENSPSIDSRCMASKGQLTGKAVLASSAHTASNMLRMNHMKVLTHINPFANAERIENSPYLTADAANKDADFSAVA